MNTLSQLKSIRNKSIKLHDWLFRATWIITIVAFAYNYWRDDVWAAIGYGVLWFIISFGLVFIFVVFIQGVITDRKIRKLFPDLLSEYQLTKSLSYEWNGQNILVVDTTKKKVFYSTWFNEYDPIILSPDDIVSIKVRDESGNEAKIEVNGDKVKKTVEVKFDLEIQYKDDVGIVKTLVIPYEKERIKAEEMGRTIGIMQ